MYKCPDCGFVSEEPGECPMCHVPMVEEEEEKEEEETSMSNS